MSTQPAQRLVAVVDDDVGLRDAISSLLRSVGLRVECFGSAEDFLQSASRTFAACLVLDLRLPGMSGLDLLRHLAASGASIAAVMLTGQPDPDGRIRDEALQAGAAQLLYKPFDDAALLSVVTSFCV
jgi:FixJ family two-component response regulator